VNDSETRHGFRVQTFLISGAWKVVASSDKEAGLSQPTPDSDFMGRARKHPSKDFSTDRPAPNPEQHSEDENGEPRNGNGDSKRNFLSISAVRGWIKFDATGPWLEKAGGPLVASLTACVAILLVLAIAWRLGLL
jgi:hypothetical protein